MTVTSADVGSQSDLATYSDVTVFYLDTDLDPKKHHRMFGLPWLHVVRDKLRIKFE